MITIGSTGVNSPDSIYPRVANRVLGTKFRIISGYKKGGAIDLAMERGEVGGRGSNSWPGLKASHPEWLKENKIHILFQMGPQRARDLPQVPLLAELGKTEEERQILEFITSNVTVGRPIVTAPQVADERVAALRKAFDDSMKDPVLIADAKKRRMEVTPISGEALQKFVLRTLSMPRPVVEKIKDLVAPASK